MKNVNVKAETKKVEKEVKEQINSVSDDQLMSDLSDLNIENLIKKTAKNRSLWKSEFKLKYSDNEKTARRKIRNEQLSLSKRVLHNILTKASPDELQKSAQNLFDFYNEGLNNFENYSNVSENESKEKFEIIHKAYSKMKLILKK